MHWSDDYSSAGPIDRLIGAATDPVSGQPELKGTPVRVTAVAPFWRGLLLRPAPSLPKGPYYWARMPLKDGHAFELAGWEPLPSGCGTESWIYELLGAPTAELVVYADPGRGAFRYVSLVGDRLKACLFLARRSAELPERDPLAAALGTEISPEARLALLAGRSGTATPHGDAGRTVCACFGVGLRTLYGTIVERRLVSVAEIGKALRAGTNCGSCIPELKGILRSVEAERAAS